MSTLPSLARSEAVQAAPNELEARIQAAERRLIAREEDLQRRLAGLGRRVRASLRPRRLVLPALGAIGAGLALWWALRRLRPALSAGAYAAAAPADGHPGRPAHGGTELPWASLLGLVWPLLPAPWRARVSPTTATTLIGIGAPIVQRLFERAPAFPPLATMPQVDLARYAGTWHEIARLPGLSEPRCEGTPTSTWRLRGERLEVLRRCRRGGRLEETLGEARVRPGSGGAKLELSLWPPALRWLPMAWSAHWILYVDPAYQAALVGHPDRRRLWVLARTPTLPTAQLEALVEFAGQHGFPAERLEFAAPAR